MVFVRPAAASHGRRSQTDPTARLRLLVRVLLLLVAFLTGAVLYLLANWPAQHPLPSASALLRSPLAADTTAIAPVAADAGGMPGDGQQHTGQAAAPFGLQVMTRAARDVEGLSAPVASEQAALALISAGAHAATSLGDGAAPGVALQATNVGSHADSAATQPRPMAPVTLAPTRAVAGVQSAGPSASTAVDASSVAATTHAAGVLRAHSSAAATAGTAAPIAAAQPASAPPAALSVEIPVTEAPARPQVVAVRTVATAPAVRSSLSSFSSASSSPVAFPPANSLLSTSQATPGPLATAARAAGPNRIAVPATPPGTPSRTPAPNRIGIPATPPAR